MLEKIKRILRDEKAKVGNNTNQKIQFRLLEALFLEAEMASQQSGTSPVEGNDREKLFFAFASVCDSSAINAELKSTNKFVSPSKKGCPAWIKACADILEARLPKIDSSSLLDRGFRRKLVSFLKTYHKNFRSEKELANFLEVVSKSIVETAVLSDSDGKKAVAEIDKLMKCLRLKTELSSVAYEAAWLDFQLLDYARGSRKEGDSGTGHHRPDRRIKVKILDVIAKQIISAEREEQSDNSSFWQSMLCLFSDSVTGGANSKIKDIVAQRESIKPSITGRGGFNPEGGVFQKFAQLTQERRSKSLSSHVGIQDDDFFERLVAFLQVAIRYCSNEEQWYGLLYLIKDVIAHLPDSEKRADFASAHWALHAISEALPKAFVPNLPAVDGNLDFLSINSSLSSLAESSHSESGSSLDSFSHESGPDSLKSSGHEYSTDLTPAKLQQAKSEIEACCQKERKKHAGSRVDLHKFPNRLLEGEIILKLLEKAEELLGTNKEEAVFFASLAVAFAKGCTIGRYAIGSELSKFGIPGLSELPPSSKSNETVNYLVDFLLVYFSGLAYGGKNNFANELQGVFELCGGLLDPGSARGKQFFEIVHERTSWFLGHHIFPAQPSLNAKKEEEGKKTPLGALLASRQGVERLVEVSGFSPDKLELDKAMTRIMAKLIRSGRFDKLKVVCKMVEKAFSAENEEERRLWSRLAEEFSEYQYDCPFEFDKSELIETTPLYKIKERFTYLNGVQKAAEQRTRYGMSYAEVSHGYSVVSRSERFVQFLEFSLPLFRLQTTSAKWSELLEVFRNEISEGGFDSSGSFPEDEEFVAAANKILKSGLEFSLIEAVLADRVKEAVEKLKAYQSSHTKEKKIHRYIHVEVAKEFFEKFLGSNESQAYRIAVEFLFAVVKGHNSELETIASGIPLGGSVPGVNEETHFEVMKHLQYVETFLENKHRFFYGVKEDNNNFLAELLGFIRIAKSKQLFQSIDEFSGFIKVVIGKLKLAKQEHGLREDAAEVRTLRLLQALDSNTEKELLKQSLLEQAKEVENLFPVPRKPQAEFVIELFKYRSECELSELNSVNRLLSTIINQLFKSNTGTCQKLTAMLPFHFEAITTEEESNSMVSEGYKLDGLVVLEKNFQEVVASIPRDITAFHQDKVFSIVKRLEEEYIQQLKVEVAEEAMLLINKGEKEKVAWLRSYDASHKGLPNRQIEARLLIQFYLAFIAVNDPYPIQSDTYAFPTLGRDESMLGPDIALSLEGSLDTRMDLSIARQDSLDSSIISDISSLDSDVGESEELQFYPMLDQLGLAEKSTWLHILIHAFIHNVTLEKNGIKGYSRLRKLEELDTSCFNIESEFEHELIKKDVEVLVNLISKTQENKKNNILLELRPFFLICPKIFSTYGEWKSFIRLLDNVLAKAKLQAKGGQFTWKRQFDLLFKCTQAILAGGEFEVTQSVEPMGSTRVSFAQVSDAKISKANKQFAFRKAVEVRRKALAQGSNVGVRSVVHDILYPFAKVDSFPSVDPEETMRLVNILVSEDEVLREQFGFSEEDIDRCAYKVPAKADRVDGGDEITDMSDYLRALLSFLKTKALVEGEGKRGAAQKFLILLGSDSPDITYFTRTPQRWFTFLQKYAGVAGEVGSLGFDKALLSLLQSEGYQSVDKIRIEQRRLVCETSKKRLSEIINLKEPFETIKRLLIALYDARLNCPESKVEMIDFLIQDLLRHYDSSQVFKGCNLVELLESELDYKTFDASQRLSNDHYEAKSFYVTDDEGYKEFSWEDFNFAFERLSAEEFGFLCEGVLKPNSFIIEKDFSEKRRLKRDILRLHNSLKSRVDEVKETLASSDFSIDKKSLGEDKAKLLDQLDNLLGRVKDRLTNIETDVVRRGLDEFKSIYDPLLRGLSSGLSSRARYHDNFIQCRDETKTKMSRLDEQLKAKRKTLAADWSEQGRVDLYGVKQNGKDFYEKFNLLNRCARRAALRVSENLTQIKKEVRLSPVGERALSSYKDSLLRKFDTVLQRGGSYESSLGSFSELYDTIFENITGKNKKISKTEAIKLTIISFQECLLEVMNKKSDESPGRNILEFMPEKMKEIVEKNACNASRLYTEYDASLAFLKAAASVVESKLQSRSTGLWRRFLSLFNKKYKFAFSGELSRCGISQAGLIKELDYNLRDSSSGVAALMNEAYEEQNILRKAEIALQTEQDKLGKLPVEFLAHVEQLFGDSFRLMSEEQAEVSKARVSKSKMAMFGDACRTQVEPVIPVLPDQRVVVGGLG